MNLKQSIRNAGPTVLTLLSIAGVIVTSLSVKKATEDFIKDKECNLNFEEEKKKLYIKHYAKPCLCGLGTIICIAGSNHMNKMNRAMLVSAYALLDQTHKEYVQKVKTLKGEEVHQEIIDAIALDHCKPPLISSSTIVGDSYLDVDSNEVKHIFYDVFSKRYFESTMSQVLQAEYHLNRNYMLGGEITVADWYEFIGLNNIDLGEEYSWWFMSYAGWQQQDGIYWIDFNHRKVVRKDGTEYIAIEFVWEPSVEPEDLPF